MWERSNMRKVTLTIDSRNFQKLMICCMYMFLIKDLQQVRERLDLHNVFFKPIGSTENYPTFEAVFFMKSTKSRVSLHCIVGSALKI